jgi:hypothetical protein
MHVGGRRGDAENGWLIALQCGHVDIGGDVCHGPTAVVDEPVSFPDVPPRVFMLYAPTGFVQGEDGVWRQSKHAATNVRYGRPQTYRRPWRGAANRGVYAIRQVEYPYVVQCPWCGHVHTLPDEQALRRLIDN